MSACGETVTDIYSLNSNPHTINNRSNLNTSKKTALSVKPGNPPKGENTEAILSRRDFLIQSFALTGAAVVLVKCDPQVCLTTTPAPCVDINSVELDVEALWIISDSELAVRIRITRNDQDRLVFSEPEAANGFIQGEPVISIDNILFVCSPDPGETQLLISITVECPYTESWLAKYSLELDVTSPEEGQFLSIINQDIQPQS